MNTYPRSFSRSLMAWLLTTITPAVLLAQQPAQHQLATAKGGFFVKVSDASTPASSPQPATTLAQHPRLTTQPAASTAPIPRPEPLTSLDPAGCDTPACIGVCEDSCSGTCGAWAHYSGVYASFLYLQARNADVAYGVPIDGPIDTPPTSNPIQIGRIGVVDPDFEPAFSVGMNLAINPLTSLDVNLTMFDSTTEDQISTAAPNVIRSMVSHPSSGSAATDFLSAHAALDIEFDTLDLSLRHLFVGGDNFAVNYVLGTRYARMEQRFDATFTNNGVENVQTDIDFDGLGIRLGLEAERHACGSPFSLYARGSASFLAGRFQTMYRQSQSFDPMVVDTSWEAGRLVPILDLEIGSGWVSRNGRLRITTGYVVSAWFNTVQTDELISAVQQNQLIDLGNTMTFDGLVTRAEWRF